MDDTPHATHIALHQHFQALKEQLDAIHAAWQRAQVAHDIPRQKALIDQERAVLVEVHEVLEAFKANLERLHPEDEPPAAPQT